MGSIKLQPIYLPAVLFSVRHGCIHSIVQAWVFHNTSFWVYLRSFFSVTLTSKPTYTMTDLEALIKKMHTEWRVLSMTDLVFNHTSKDSPWLLEHPEVAFNMSNAPHLRPAYLVDRILYYFSQEVGNGQWESMGVPATITDEGHLQVSQHSLQLHISWNAFFLVVISITRMIMKYL